MSFVLFAVKVWIKLRKQLGVLSLNLCVSALWRDIFPYCSFSEAFLKNRQSNSGDGVANSVDLAMISLRYVGVNLV